MNHSKPSHLTPVSFISFWQFIAKELGNSRLKVNTAADSIHDFIVTGGEQKAYLRDAIKHSYKTNQCHHLGSNICLTSVLDILGEAAYQLQSNKQDDLFDIELLEEIAWLISQRFADHFETKKNAHAMNSAKLSNKTNRALSNNVTSLPKAKIRRANALL